MRKKRVEQVTQMAQMESMERVVSGRRQVLGQWMAHRLPQSDPNSIPPGAEVHVQGKPYLMPFRPSRSFLVIGDGDFSWTRGLLTTKQFDEYIAQGKGVNGKRQNAAEVKRARV